MKVYPVVIPTLCRYSHFQRCVDSLKKCYLAEQTELVIGVDYPLYEVHVSGYEKIKDYVKKINGFKKITILYANENLGAIKNMQRLVKYVYEKYDAFILTEDDNEFSPCFLEFMNYSLNNFKNDDRISAITGYSPIDYENITNNPIILSNCSYMWGCGLWKNKAPIKGTSYYDEICRDLRKTLKILKKQPSALGMLLEMLYRNTLYGDVCRTIDNILDDKYILMPSFSMSRNIGQDGSGLHSGINYKIQTQTISLNYHFSYTQDDFERALTETQQIKYKRRSFFIMLSSNRIKALLQIIRIIFRWFVYRLTNFDKIK